ncbi:MAG TPA: hypothetical protein VFO77_00530 [Actinoplanes sp.]|nr:hypothetical protein [Actinoplanes sp.]
MIDTGSLQPLPDAVLWAERADAWAQRPATGEPGRWSEVTGTSRSTFPPEGVGWRSETAEWQSTTDTARWRTTTEWRSSEGTSGWRSTTEAWQTGGNHDGRRPPAEPPTRQPAISGTAWPTPSPAEQPWSASAATAAPWQQETTPTWQGTESTQTPWQGRESTPSWQQETRQQAARPAWQQPVDTPPSWQLPGGPIAPQPPAQPTPSWQTPAGGPASWAAPTESAPGRHASSDAPSSWQPQADPPPSRQQAAPSWQQAESPAHRLPQPDERPQWSAPTEPSATPWQPETGSARSIEAPSAWQSASAAPAVPRGPQNAGRATPPPVGPATSYTGTWSVPAYDDGRHLVREDDREQWRREYGTPGRVGRRRAAEPDDAPVGGTGWAAGHAPDHWAAHSDTTEMSLYLDRGGRDERSRPDPRPARPQSWQPREDAEPDGWARERDADEDRWERGADPARPDVEEVRRPEVDPGPRRRDEPARGPAGYRTGSTDDWRRELSAGSALADGESKRFPTSDFPPFRASGTAAASLGSAPVSGRRGFPGELRDSEPREELLVGAPVGRGSWQSPPDTQWPPRGTGPRPAGVAGPYERRPVGTIGGPSARRNLLDDVDEEFEEITGGPLAAVGYTALWYGVPVVLVLVYMLALGTQQSHALQTLVNAAPQFALSLALSMVVAAGLRWISGSWKAASVGLAAAVMGGGLATVLMSAITDRSLS